MTSRSWIGIALIVLLPCAQAAGQGIGSIVRSARPTTETPSERTSGPVETPSTQEEGPPRSITAADYGRWESLGRPVLSPDGRWLAYTISRTSGDDELRLRMLATDATETFEHGQRPVFSGDTTWLAFAIGVSEAEREKAQKADRPVRPKLGLHSLVDGTTVEVEDIASFAFSDDGRFLVMRHARSREQKHDGVTIVVRDLATGLDTTFGNVASDAWNDDGTLLAMLVDVAGDVGHGVLVYDAASGRLRTLDSSDTGYATMAWREDHPDLAVLRQTAHDAEKDEEPSHVVLAWRGLDGDDARRRVFDHAADESFPQDMRVVEYAGLRWSDDGETIFFGIRPWEKRPAADPEADGDDETKKTAESTPPDTAPDAEQDENRGGSLRETLKDPSNVEVWHARDVDIIPRQKRTASRDRRESHLVAWWPESGSFVRLGTDLTEDVRLMEGHQRAIGLDNTPYEQQRMFGPTLHDIYVIDVKTGERSRILERVKYQYASCPTGRYLLYLRDETLWSYDLDTGAHIDLTGDVDTHFVNQEMSTLTDEKPIYGIAGWTEDGRHVVLYDRFDIWMLSADGDAVRRLTEGAERQIRHRRVIVDPDDEEFIDPDQAMLLSLYGERTKRSGYARLRLGDPVERLRWVDHGVSRLVKADDADVYAWVEEAFDDSPDVYVAGPSFDDRRQVTETNPFQAEYLWGRSELIDYENANGVPLQGALFYPAGYEPGRAYPMIVYIYERLSQTLHGFATPSERNPYNTAVFTSQGYFVLRPDIVYRPQNPGISALECVVPAVRAVLETGMVDEDRIGLIGHSWGAYQTAFIVTQTDLFAAGIAGAPLTNMMSMSMSIYWNSGQTDAWIFHESQGRMDRPFWQDVDTYIRNSPIFSIDDMNTPLLIAFGTEDGAVDFNQGVELYNAARLAGKQFVMLVYPGENHGLRQKPNQVDYHHRVLEWFGHYLKGEPAEPWITEGVEHLDRQKQIEAMKKAASGGRRGRGD